MKRDVYTFLSGLFAGFAIEHAVIAIYLSAGVFDLPEIMGRQWPDWSPWLAAALYAAVSLWLGYLAWRRKGAAQREVRVGGSSDLLRRQPGPGLPGLAG